MKLPKKIQICGITYDVTKNPELDLGGRAATRRQVIEVGWNGSDARRFSTLVHEIMEIAAVERNLRYDSVNNGLQFVCTHKEFDMWAHDVAAALWNIRKCWQ